MKLIKVYIFTVLAVAWLSGNTVNAASLIYSFSTLPLDGQITGSSGQLIGWGYTLSNTDNTDWFVATQLSASSMTLGTPDGSYFDFPILQPNQTIVTNFDIGLLSGLYGLQINNSVLPGQTDSGFFTLTGEWWSGNPLSGGTFIQNAVTETIPFSVLVTENNTVPIANTLFLTLLGMALLCQFLPKEMGQKKYIH